MSKGFTVRLDDDQAAELEAVARADGVPVAVEIGVQSRPGSSSDAPTRSSRRACVSRSRRTSASSSAWPAEWSGPTSMSPTSW